MPCYEYGDVTICGPADFITYREEKESERWCFSCRKRSAGTWRLRGEPPEVMSYYGPMWFYACDNCGQDGMYGFGRERVWAE
jgi:hypothetical protein